LISIVLASLGATSAVVAQAPPAKKDPPKLDIKVLDPDPDEDDAKTVPPPTVPPPNGPAPPKHEESEPDPRAKPIARPKQPDDVRARERAKDEPPEPELNTPVESRFEEENPRPVLPDVDPPGKPPWQRHGELGVDFVWLARPFAKGLVDSPVRYKPYPALGFHLRWEIFRWLQFSPYFVWGEHPVHIPPGSLSTSSPNTVRRDAVIDSFKVSTFAFGAKVAPTWPIRKGWRLWLSAGVGYGRFGFHNMKVTEGNKSYDLPNRDGVFVELPVGLGISYDVLPRWLVISYEASGAAVVGQSGPAHTTDQAVDADGKVRDVGPVGAIQASFVQTLGIGIIL
jgi:hypothetical protein